MADAVPFFAASSHLQALLLCQAASPLRRLGALQPLGGVYLGKAGGRHFSGHLLVYLVPGGVRRLLAGGEPEVDNAKVGGRDHLPLWVALQPFLGRQGQ